jgi:RNA polymerase sigma-70 factor (ECF subfamily)
MTMPHQQFLDLYARQVGVVYRVCFSFMKNRAATEDAVQETFIKALTKAPDFDGPAHEQAWLVRTAGNVCKDMLKSWWHKTVIHAVAEDVAAEPVADETLAAVMALPDRYKQAVYLFYYEGYTTKQIAQALRRRESTVRSHLSEARALLRERIGGNDKEP